MTEFYDAGLGSVALDSFVLDWLVLFPLEKGSADFSPLLLRDRFYLVVFIVLLLFSIFLP